MLHLLTSVHDAVDGSSRRYLGASIVAVEVTIERGADCFGAVVRAGTFSAAARQLGLSLPVVRKLVSRLESEAGATLFDWTTKTLKLTPEAINQLAEWVRDGRLARNEHVLDGPEAARGAIKMLYEGRNTGKLLVRVD